jgi:rare lipoprotein A (peptidoglycan hydrolase)
VTAAVLAALAAAGGGAYLLLAGRSGPSDEAELWASAQRDRDALLVPRRRPPRVVEPQAGDVGGVATPVEEESAPAPRAKLDDDEEAAPPEHIPSDAAVRRELAKLEEAKRRYDFAGLDFSGQLVPFDALPTDGWRQSVASVYYDFHQGLACGGVLKPEQLGVAHKTAPCGTMVTFRYGERAIRVPVIDRGPYIAGREWDFTAATAAALGFPGLGAVEWHL